MIRVKLLLRCLLIPLGVGFLGSVLAGGGSMRELYALLPKPPFSPPGILFPVVWTVLYLMMGVSDYLCRCESGDSPLRRQVYWIQLVLSGIWPFIFFRLTWFGWALVELAVLLVAVVLLTFLSRRASAPAAALLLPYILWVLYAGYLCWGVFTLS